jgi:DNA invertase Pin-like site-specific DNA recombinase
VKAKRGALYVRVSSGEQSTGAQERELREYVQRRGWKLQQIYRNHGISGASSNRPALKELMKAFDGDRSMLSSFGSLTDLPAL